MVDPMISVKDLWKVYGPRAERIVGSAYADLPRGELQEKFGNVVAMREVNLDVEDPVTPRSILDALEARYPMLCGTIRDHVTGKRRPLLRFFACDADLSHESPDAPLPDAVVMGAEPLLIVGAMAGG